MTHNEIAEAVRDLKIETRSKISQRIASVSAEEFKKEHDRLTVLIENCSSISHVWGEKTFVDSGVYWLRVCMVCTKREIC